eukprot:scaffold79932_cov70-Phaeocystis_antarctica.AAC.3
MQLKVAGESMQGVVGPLCHHSIERSAARDLEQLLVLVEIDLGRVWRWHGFVTAERRPSVKHLAANRL